MTRKRNQKIIWILVIALMITITFSPTVKAALSTAERREIEASAREEAIGMSKQSLQEAIEALEEEMQESRESDDDYGGSEQEAIDRAVLNTYKSVYRTKTGNSYGTGSSSPITDPILNPGDYDPTNTDVETHKTARLISALVGIVRVVGSVIAVIALTILGIKYMFGSTENKAKYKESMIPYIIGIVMLVAVVNILGILYNIFFNI